MKINRWHMAWMSVSAFLNAVAILPAAIVYQNTTTSTGVTNELLAQGEISSTEHGNEVTLGGTERVVNQFTIGFRINGQCAAGFTLRVRFRLNDGPDGRPGTVIWDSGPIFHAIDCCIVLFYSVPVPNIVVPDHFTYTVQCTDRIVCLAPIGPAEYGPPTVGAAGMGFWRKTGEGPEDWEYTGLAESPFGARIDAIGCAGGQDGDLNGDGSANGLDVSEMATAVIAGSTDAADVCRADFNGNAVIDFGDLSGFVQAVLGN